MIRLINRLKNSFGQTSRQLSPFSNLHGITALTNKFSKKNLAWSAGLLAFATPLAFAYGLSGEHRNAHASFISPSSSVSKVGTNPTDARPVVPAAGSSSSSSHTQVSVNGQNIDVPENGSVKKIMTDGITQTTVNVDSSSSSTANSGTVANNSNLSINLTSNSSHNSGSGGE